MAHRLRQVRATRSDRGRGRGVLGPAAAVVLSSLLVVGLAWALDAPHRRESATVAARQQVCRLEQSKGGRPLFDASGLTPRGPGAATTTQFWLKAWPSVNQRTGVRDRCLLYVSSFGVTTSGARLARQLVLTVSVRTRRKVPVCSRAQMGPKAYRTCLARRRRLSCSPNLSPAKLRACRRRVARLLAPYYRRLYSGRIGGSLRTPRRLTFLAPGVRDTYRVSVRLASSASNALQGLGSTAGLRWQTAQVPGHGPSPHGFTGAVRRPAVIWLLGGDGPPGSTEVAP